MRAALLALALVVPALAAAAALPPPSDPGQVQLTSDLCARPAPLPPCNLWASRLPLGPANEVHIAVNPLNPQHLLAVAKDYGLGANGDCRPAGALHVASASYVTKDGGATWSVGRVPAPYPNGGAQPSPLPWLCGSDPVAAFGPDGTAYYILLNFQYTGGRKATIAVARSPDGGLTWPASDIRMLHTASGDDKEWGAVDSSGRVHVVWTDTGNGRILYSRSDAAFNFEAPRQLAIGGGGNPAVTVAAGPGGEVYVVWRDGGAIRFTRSLDGGATFAPVRVAFSTTPYDAGGPPRFPFMPQIAVDRNPASPFAGRIYVTWPDARNGDSDVYMASSGDRGDSWTAATRVDDFPLPQRRQVLPTVSVAPNGRVDVAWMDQRLGASIPAQQFAQDLFHAFASHSVDGGATWSANRLVSEVPLVSSFSHHQDGSVFIGDYMGIASTDDFAYPIFPGNGVDRLAQGLGPDDFARADAYTAPVGTAGLVPDALARAPAGIVGSIEVGELQALAGPVPLVD
ncbi:MAG TPA: hypothetical protein VGR28_12995 [Candidatus Thermoplasmatota archaeon]|jgi:hypothetical protein|nr:hypothetical protein [Candidatus Thermoplasmatota archaeon]